MVALRSRIGDRWRYKKLLRKKRSLLPHLLPRLIVLLFKTTHVYYFDILVVALGRIDTWAR